MMHRTRALFLFTVLCVSQKYALGDSKPLEMKWSELAPLISGHHVALSLTDGMTLKGEAVAVREDSILMEVSSSVGSYAKGNGSIPRNSITLIDLQRTRGAWGRTMGTVIGVLSGMGIGGYVAGTRADSAGAGIATFVGIASGISVGGYYAGRALDKRTTHIKVVP